MKISRHGSTSAVKINCVPILRDPVKSGTRYPRFYGFFIFHFIPMSPGARLSSKENMIPEPLSLRVVDTFRREASVCGPLPGRVKFIGNRSAVENSST